MLTSPRDLPGRPCALQLNSGMNRLGLDAADLDATADLLPRLAPVLALSHLACADTPDHPMNRRQAEAFAALAARLPGVRLSLAATGGILLGPGFHHGLTRPGIGLYGGLPFADARPVVTLSLPVIQVRDLAAGEPSATAPPGPPPRPSPHRHRRRRLRRRPARARSAAARSGSSPATPPARWSAGSRWISITVDVTGLAEVPDHLEILNARQTVDDLAAAAGTIGYEILTSLGPRHERVYKGPRRSPRTPHDPPPPRLRLPRLDRPLDPRAPRRHRPADDLRRRRRSPSSSARPSTRSSSAASCCASATSRCRSSA